MHTCTSATELPGGRTVWCSRTDGHAGAHTNGLHRWPGRNRPALQERSR